MLRRDFDEGRVEAGFELPPLAHDLAGNGREHVRQSKEGGVGFIGDGHEERLCPTTAFACDEALSVVLDVSVGQGQTKGAGHRGLDRCLPFPAVVVASIRNRLALSRMSLSECCHDVGVFQGRSCRS